jgi:hypothetical protein
MIWRGAHRSPGGPPSGGLRLRHLEGARVQFRVDARSVLRGLSGNLAATGA